ncbi:MAG: hypothetical protein A3F40_01475 [Chlamydiae bacterium RIFCSPHIGHO2_12_FULL_27_8]|nr:MAG: hypothetical protein A3F40_01475 [Chlamydiae bacterium RIFCSPHIGHO2_12_FULL_27_8]OGN64944.1 MAG: hypothetical protein A2888_01865 [Chlamydiae bacterium RIFCSPLOWO2_01_FULL_28_7]
MIYKVIIVGSLYAIPRIVEHISSEPKEDEISRINSLRHLLYPFKNDIVKKIPPIVYDIGHLFARYGWFPIGIIFLLDQFQPMSIVSIESYVRFVLACVISLEVFSVYQKIIGEKDGVNS